jgi:hypothetical protein
LRVKMRCETLRIVIESSTTSTVGVRPACSCSSGSASPATASACVSAVPVGVDSSGASAAKKRVSVRSKPPISRISTTLPSAMMVAPEIPGSMFNGVPKGLTTTSRRPWMPSMWRATRSSPARTMIAG